MFSDRDLRGNKLSVKSAEQRRYGQQQYKAWSAGRLHRPRREDLNKDRCSETVTVPIHAGLFIDVPLQAYLYYSSTICLIRCNIQAGVIGVKQENINSSCWKNVLASKTAWMNVDVIEFIDGLQYECRKDISMYASKPGVITVKDVRHETVIGNFYCLSTEQPVPDRI